MTRRCPHELSCLWKWLDRCEDLLSPVRFARPAPLAARQAMEAHHRFLRPAFRRLVDRQMDMVNRNRTRDR